MCPSVYACPSWTQTTWLQFLPKMPKAKGVLSGTDKLWMQFFKNGKPEGKIFFSFGLRHREDGEPVIFICWLANAGLSHPTVSAGNCEIMIAFQGLNFTLLPLHILNYLPEKRRWEGLRELSSLQQRPQESLQPLTLLSMSEMKL